MRKGKALISRIWQSKEWRGLWFNLALAVFFLVGGLSIFQMGLAVGRADPTAPLFFDSVDLQTLTASAFIGVAVVLLIYGLRYALLTLKLLTDLAQGPALLVGYVTTRQTESWRRDSRYRLYLVSRQAFPLWLRGPDLPEDSEIRSRKNWRYTLPTVVPRIFHVPSWIYEAVREGDLIELHYARWRRIVLDVAVIESVLSPPSPTYFPPEAETAEWRIIEPED
ncbi:MAG: hypothetical protein WCS37_20730 [Chloroflexota bacterium]